MSRYRIRIDRSLCSGMASCVKIAPDAFELDGEGIAVTPGVGDERALEAAECCPLGAIAAFDEATGRRLV
jgi:ferredoxin